MRHVHWYTPTSLLQGTLATLCTKYNRVFFVPGNHDLWAFGKGPDSVDKFFSILDMCDRIGVLYFPAPVARRTQIWPLFSWHSPALGDPDTRSRSVSGLG